MAEMLLEQLPIFVRVLMLDLEDLVDLAPPLWRLLFCLAIMVQRCVRVLGAFLVDFFVFCVSFYDVWKFRGRMLVTVGEFSQVSLSS